MRALTIPAVLGTALVLAATAYAAGEKPAAPAPEKAKPAAAATDKAKAPAADKAKPAAEAKAPAAADKAPAPDAPVARVNGTVITQGEFDRNWQFFLQRSGIPGNHAEKDGKVEDFRKQVLDRLVDEELLYQDAKSRKLLASEETVAAELAKAREQFPTAEAYEAALKKNGLTEAGLRALFTRNLSIQGLVEKDIAGAVTVTDAEVHEFYVGNKAAFETPEQVRARHILIKVEETDTPEAKAAKRAKAEGLLKQLKDGANFEELAKANSECPSAPMGGDLGFFERGQMVPAFDDVAFALKPGELSGVVETEFGFHIIRVDEKRPAGIMDEKEVAPQVSDFLKSRKTDEAVQARLKTLREKASVELLMKL